jgi:hypothetical protein
MRILIGLSSLFLAVLLTSCASASPPSQVATEYITQLVEVRPAMTTALAADPLYCPAVLPAANVDLTDGYVGCGQIAADNAGQVRGLQRLILGREPSPPDI